MKEQQLYNTYYNKDGEVIGRENISPITSIQTVYDTNGRRLDEILRSIVMSGGGGGTFSVEIGANNHWFINGVDSGVSATGPQGPQGPKGDNYNLTAADKQTIAGLVTANTKQMVVTYEDGTTETINVVVKV